MMENNVEDIISQQISTAILALSNAKSNISNAEVNQHLHIAAAIIQDIQFKIILQQAG